MKAIAVLFSALVLTATTTLLKAASTGQVTGKIIVAETQQLLGSTEIIFENSMDKQVLKSDPNGIYYGDHLPTGKYTVTVIFNNRTFVMKNVRVYDGYATEVNFTVSTSEKLSEIVFVEKQEKLISSISPTDIMLGNSDNNQPTRSLNEALSSQPGVDVRDGRIYVKGSSDIRFFIDGTPIMGQPTIQRGW